MLPWLQKSEISTEGDFSLIATQFFYCASMIKFNFSADSVIVAAASSISRMTCPKASKSLCIFSLLVLVFSMLLSCFQRQFLCLSFAREHRLRKFSPSPSRNNCCLFAHSFGTRLLNQILPLLQKSVSSGDFFQLMLVWFLSAKHRIVPWFLKFLHPHPTLCFDWNFFQGNRNSRIRSCCI